MSDCYKSIFAQTIDKKKTLYALFDNDLTRAFTAS